MCGKEKHNSFQFKCWNSFFENNYLVYITKRAMYSSLLGKKYQKQRNINGEGQSQSLKSYESKRPATLISLIHSNIFENIFEAIDHYHKGTGVAQ